VSELRMVSKLAPIKVGERFFLPLLSFLQLGKEKMAQKRKREGGYVGLVPRQLEGSAPGPKCVLERNLRKGKPRPSTALRECRRERKKTSSGGKKKLLMPHKKTRVETK